jgi:hypothetical protein
VYITHVQPVAFALVLLVTALPVQVTGDGCPDGPEVEQALAAVLSADPAAFRQHVAHVRHRAGRLLVTLVDAAGAVLAEHDFDSNGDCGEQAKLAAVFIASWESEVHPEFARPQAEPPSVPAPVPPPLAPSAYQLAAGLSLGLAGSLAPGGSLGAAWFPRGVGLGLGLVLAGESTRTLDLGTGHARWRRWTASPEAAWRWGRGPLVLDAHAGLSLAWLVASGVDFSQNETQHSFALAITAGLRSAWWMSRHFAAWVDLRAFVFSKSDQLWGEPSGSHAEVPRLGGILSIGVALGRGPGGL